MEICTCIVHDRDDEEIKKGRCINDDGCGKYLSKEENKKYEAIKTTEEG